MCIIDRYTVVTNGSHSYILKTTMDIHGNYWFIRKNYMAIREIYGSIGKEMINGKFYSMSEARHAEIFGKKKGKTNEINELSKKKSKKS